MLATIDHIFLFFASSLLLALSPGPDILYVLSVGITKGKAKSFACALGFTSGLIVHTGLVALGVADLIVHSQSLFETLKFLGAFYLIYLGITFLRSKDIKISSKILKSQRSFLFFRRSFLASLINPKVLIFFLSFLPQFIHPQTQHTSLALFFLGLIFMGITFLCFSVTSLISGHLHHFFKSREKYLRLFNLASGVALIFIAVLMTLTPHSIP